MMPRQHPLEFWHASVRTRETGLLEASRLARFLHARSCGSA